MAKKEQTRRSLFGSRRAEVQTLEARTMFSATPAADAEAMVAQANNAFAFDLLRQLHPDSSGNLFFSPYSAATALEMALQGAKGVTANEMIQALHLPGGQLARAGIEALNQLFASMPATADFELSSANRLWVNQNLPLLDAFIADSQQVFGAAPQSVNFGDPATAAKTINDWVSAQTHGKITDLIPAGDLSDLTALVITNAVYFKNDWAKAFNAGATGPSPFQISSTEAATVQMMYQSSNLSYFAQSGTDGFQAVDLPYKDGNFDMIVILPNTYDLGGFQSSLTPSLFSQISDGLSPNYVNVHLPSFELNETYQLTQPLENLGIQTAFSDTADFGGIANNPMQITDVVQKSYLKVNETGTEAAAATGLVATVMSGVFNPNPPVEFNADHPFYFAIRERTTNTILFMGAVSDPSHGQADFATHATPLPDSIVTTVPKAPVPLLPTLPFSPITIPETGLTLSETANKVFTATLATTDLSAASAGAKLGVTINWGHGKKSAGTLNADGTSFDIVGTHRYHDHKTHHVTIKVWQKLHGHRVVLKLIESTVNVSA